MSYEKIEIWLSKNPKVVIAIIAALTILLIAAMFLGLDLSWIPGLLRIALTGHQ